LIGQKMTTAQTLAEIRKDRIFHEDSGGGATFSGGEPLMQFDFLCDLLGACRAEGIHTALDTCGHAPRSQLLAAAALSDLVLYDLKAMDDARHTRFTGVSNERILDNLRALGAAHSNLWVRIPIIPGLNDDDADLDAAARFAASIPAARRVCLLPYHPTGAAKFRRLGQKYCLDHVVPPSPQRLEQIAQRFKDLGLNVTTGG
jgi:pyruvate formate lyase activating enzyme